MRFSYSAVTRSGERVTGRIDAEDKIEAIRVVERLGHIPTSITPIPPLPAESPVPRTPQATHPSLAPKPSPIVPARPVAELPMADVEDASVSAQAKRGHTQDTPEFRYWAFISYSSQDKTWARWLHQAIETFGVPAELVNRQQTPSGHPVPKRFHPVFRDRDELSASADLGVVIRESLRASRYLIVICSPRAAQSTWVNAEIDEFLALGRREHILAVIVDGEPNTGDARECFPPALRKFEPIAADARPEGDGRTNAKLKLLAGMLGVRFDSLKQRDKRRRSRRVLLAGGVLLLLAALVGVAEQQRSAAAAARSVAEQQRSAAAAASRLASEESKRGNRNFYAKKMTDIQDAWDRGNMPHFRKMLDELKPETNSRGPDLRGFEWHYWARKQVQTELLTLLPNGSARVARLAGGPNGNPASAMPVVSSADVKQMPNPNVGPMLWGRSRSEITPMPAPPGMPYFSSPVVGVQFDPGGKTLSAVYADGIVHTWNAEHGGHLLSLNGRQSNVSLTCFSPDGRLMAMVGMRIAASLGSSNREGDDPAEVPVSILDTEGGGVLRALKCDMSKVVAMCFSPDGSRIFVAGFSKQTYPAVHRPTSKGASLLSVWNTSTGEKLATLAEHDTEAATIYDICLSADGRQLAWCGTESCASGLRATARLIDASDGRVQRAIAWDDTQIFVNVRLSPDGRLLATADSDGGVRLWETGTGKERLELGFRAATLESSRNLCFNRDGSLLAAGNEDYFKVWDTRSGQVFFAPKATGIRGASFSPDGSRLATGDKLGTVKIWGLAQYDAPPLVTGIHGQFCESGGKLVVEKPGQLEIWNTQEPRPVTLIVQTNAFVSKRLSPDGSLLGVCEPGRVVVWDVFWATCVRQIDEVAQTVCFDRHNRRMACANKGAIYGARLPNGNLPQLGKWENRATRNVSVWDLETVERLYQIDGSGGASEISFSADGKLLGALWRERSDHRDAADTLRLRVWDAATGKELTDKEARFKSADELRSTRHDLWESFRSLIYRNSGGGLDTCMSPDGHRLARIRPNANGLNSVIHLSDEQDDMVLIAFKEHSSDIVDVTFTPDGSRLLSVDRRALLRIWDASSIVAADNDALFKPPPPPPRLSPPPIPKRP